MGRTNNHTPEHTEKKPKKSTQRINAKCLIFYGAPGAIRTPDLLIRSQELYPAELLALRMLFISHLSGNVNCLFKFW